MSRNSQEGRVQKNDIIKPSDFTDPNDMLRYIDTPEPHIMRTKARNAFKDGTMPMNQINCPHRMARVEQYFDYLNDSDRHGRPTNAFVCQECNATLFLVDGAGKSAADG